MGCSLPQLVRPRQNRTSERPIGALARPSSSCIQGVSPHIVILLSSACPHIVILLKSRNATFPRADALLPVLALQPNEKKDTPSLKEQFGALRYLVPFFRMIYEVSPGLTLVNVLLRLVKAGLPLAILYVGKLIIDEVVRLAEAGGGDYTQLWTFVAIEAGLAILSEAINRAMTLGENLLGDLFTNATSVRLIHKAAQLDLYQFEDSDFYDKLERARRQTTSRTVLMGQVLTQVQDILTLGFLAAGIIYFSPWLIAILALSVIPAFLGESHFNRNSYSLTQSWTPQRRELDYLRYIGASDQTAKEVKIFGLSDFLADRFKQLSDEYYDANKKLATQRATVGGLLSIVGTLAYYGAYVYILWQAAVGVITIGTLTFLGGSFQRLQTLLQGVVNRFSKIAESSLYLQDLFDFFDLEPTIQNSEGALDFPRPIQRGFEFRNVSFQYPGASKAALSNVSFTLYPGEKLALVGENGAGKTTLVKLLARLYEPTSGQILLDGRDLRDYDLASLRNAIGVIFQDYIRFQFSAGDNIGVGEVDQLHEQPLIEEAAQKSLADTVISELPGGYQQVLGKRFRGGVDLSGGQWQKIALGRAYMKDAELLILDEPTSALDARAEHEVFERFAALLEGKSAVLISHRFSTVRMADRILVLRNGSVLEIGSHEELVAKGGKYAELFELQEAGYR